MDLNFLPSKEKDITIKFTLKESEVDDLKQLTKFTSEQYDGSLGMQDVLVAMVRTELNKNKAFKTWLKRKQKEQQEQKEQQNKDENGTLLKTL